MLPWEIPGKVSEFSEDWRMAMLSLTHLNPAWFIFISVKLEANTALD